MPLNTNNKKLCPANSSFPLALIDYKQLSPLYINVRVLKLLSLFVLFFNFLLLTAMIEFNDKKVIG